MVRQSWDRRGGRGGRVAAPVLNSPALVAVGVVAAVLLSGCSSGAGSPAASAGAGSPVGSPSGSPAVPVTALKLAVSPLDAAEAVRLDQPVTVTVAGGTLTGVTVSTDQGTELAGQIDAAASSWTSSAALKSGSDYSVTAYARAADGSAANLTTHFSTLRPDATVKASILPQDDWTVGVGMPVIINFTKSVQDRAAVEKATSVSSTPVVAGGWHWMSGRELQWRPEVYWPSGTKVVVKAGLSGVEVAPDVWGSRSVSSTFSIGSAMVSTVDVAGHTLTVTRDGQVIKTIPVTTGKRGYETRAGTKVIISRESSRVMDAATTGVDPKDPNYYRLDVKYAMRLTWSGEFLHAAPWSVGSQGRANVSHGCTGMSTSNAKWLFDHSKVGDVVVYQHSKRPLEWGNGYTAWNIAFTKWASAA